MTARATTAIGNNGGSGLSVDDLAIDHEIAQLSSGVRFLLEVTPLNVDVARAAYLEGGHEQPGFAYRTLDTPPDVLDARLRKIDVSAVADPTLQHLLRAPTMTCLLYTSPSPRDRTRSRMPSSA